MNKNFFALRELPKHSTFGKGDFLVLFGELFQRGYANGLVEEAERRGMTIIKATVGRREKDGTLRPLNDEEIANVSGKVINVPLEAGFDYEPDSKGLTPIDYLREVKLSEWEKAKVPEQSLQESRQKGVARFRSSVATFMKELESIIPENSNVLMAHLMAGGVPRAKIVMPLMNRAFKGTGDRYLSSEQLWNSGVGQLCKASFLDVTAETFDHFIELSENFRNRAKKNNKHIGYTAYGYHGTEVWMGGKYQWQTYTPYIQGWAKRRLEEISQTHFAKGVSCCVYNCPEILTNSSSIFQGVEVSLYPLIASLLNSDALNASGKKLREDCRQLLREDVSLEKVVEFTDSYLTHPLIRQFCDFAKWPQHSSQEQLELMLKSSNEVISMHKNEKELMTGHLSESVLRTCGEAMVLDSFSPKHPVQWIGHDLVAKSLLKDQ